MSNKSVQEALIPPKPSLLAKLKQIKIEAPEDFAANLDDYLSGGKQIEQATYGRAGQATATDDA